MALTIELQQVIKNDDGIFSVYLRVVRADGTMVGKPRELQAESADQLKVIVTSIFKKLVKTEKNREAIRAIAQGVIDEIMAEVTQ